MQPEANYLKESVLGTLLVVAALLVLHAIPEFDVGSFHFKRINIVADILKDKPKPILADTLIAVKPVYVDTCKTGITCIEDYSADTSGMYAFLSALDSTKVRNVRIAYFADSYVEGDIMLAPLRDTLQATFGGSGVGFVPVTSEVAGFRQTIIHSYENWTVYSIMGDKSKEHPLGPAGFTFVPGEKSEANFRATNKKRLNNFATAQLFYGNTNGSKLLINDNDTLNLPANHSLKKLDLGKGLAAFKLAGIDTQAVDIYGISVEDAHGISVDNFATRGNSGVGLASVSEQMYRNFDSVHHYDLVVLAYGLNVASEKAKNYDWYMKSMSHVVQTIKKAFPNSSILLIGCSDRAAKVDNDIKTMPMLKELVRVQRKIAADNKICFWNMFEAMGGDSTMVRWAATKPTLANKDYTHLTFYGGRKVAQILMGTLLYEKEKFDRKKKSM